MILLRFLGFILVVTNHCSLFFLSFLKIIVFLRGYFMDAFLGSINTFGFNFAPRGWALCQGQLLAISQNSALFSLLGTTYGGDGRTSFGLPDLRGRASVGMGHGPGLSNYSWGERGGSETRTLTSLNLPSHTHNHTYSGGTGSGAAVNVAKVQGGHQTPSAGDYIGMPSNSFGDAPEGKLYVDEAAATAAGTVSIGGVIGGGFNSHELMIANTGGGQYFPILQPFFGHKLLYCYDGDFS